MPEEEALRIVRGVALALEHAHQEGVVHRDIKPGNILIGKDGAVKLADYGLAKGPLEDQELTKSGVTVGTPQYISPEQARGPSEVDIRTDLYSLGATLFHMVTGRTPYQGETLAHLIQQVLYERYAPPRTLRRDLSKDVDFLIEKLMARQPRHRYQNPKELLRDLDALDAGKSIVPAGWQGDFEVYHEKKRLRKLVLAVLVVLVLGSVSAVYMTVRLKRVEEETIVLLSERDYGSLTQDPITRENINEKIRDATELQDKYGKRPAALKAGEYLDHLLSERRYLQSQNDLRLKVAGLKEKGEWAEALRAIKLHRERLPEKGAELGTKEAEEQFISVKAERDEWVADEIESMGERLLDEADPREALDALNPWLKELERGSYLEVDRRDELAETEQLVNNLFLAINRIDKLLRPVKELLSAEEKRDYREIRQSLAEAMDEFREDDELERVLSRLPLPWAKDLTRDLPDLDDRIVAANDAEAGEVAADAGELLAEGRYDEALDLYADLSLRSVDEISVQLATEQRRLVDERRDLQADAQETWNAFLPVFAGHLSRREWSQAWALLDSLRQSTAGIQPNPLVRQTFSAEHFLNLGRDMEHEFLSKIDGMDSVAGGLRIGGVTYPEVYDVSVEGRMVTFRSRRGGRKESHPVSQLSAEYLMRIVGRPEGDALTGVVNGLLKWGDLKARGAPRRLFDELPGIVELILSGSVEGEGRTFAEALGALIRREWDEVGMQLAEWEHEAAEKLTEALLNLDRRNYRDAYDGFDLLLKSKRLSTTDYVQHRKDEIESYRAQAKERLPSVKMAEFTGARVDYVKGGSVDSHTHVVAFFYDMENPEEIRRLELTSGLVGIVQMESPPIGPPSPWEAPDQERTVVEHQLRFQQSGKEGDELDRHPLRIESPFLYNRPMSVEFRVRWDRPLAMVLSLCGTNVVVLSDTSRLENGRGVHIWQAGDISQPCLKVPDELRTSHLRRFPDLLQGESIHHRYFQFEAERWYRVRFVKGDKLAELYVDDRLILEKTVKKYGVDGPDIVFLTYSPCELDEMRILGTVDPRWFNRIPRRMQEEAARIQNGEQPK